MDSKVIPDDSKLKSAFDDWESFKVYTQVKSYRNGKLDTLEPGTDLAQQQFATAEVDHAAFRTCTAIYAYRAKLLHSVPKPLGGILAAINGGVSSVPIDNTPRNTELFHLCKSINSVNLN